MASSFMKRAAKNGDRCWVGNATVKRYHFDDHAQLRTHLADFLAAYNFGRRLKTLGGVTPYEYVCKIWISEPDRLILKPIHLGAVDVHRV